MHTDIISLIRREVVPALGCTEPTAVALAVARATELWGGGEAPSKIEVRLSANVLKNAMGVGIPGTGMIGLPIAIALGSLIGKSSLGLEVLRGVSPEAVERGQALIESGAISIDLAKDAPSKLYIEARVSGGGHRAEAVIAGGHTDFVRETRDEEVLLNKPIAGSGEADAEKVELTMRRVWDFAMTAPLDDIRFILEARDLNKSVSESARKHTYGHNVGNILAGERAAALLGNGVLVKLLSTTCAACDARMAGAMDAVMSNSGSGNQGIAATLPVVSYAEQVGASEEQLIRALILSHLTAIYIKQSLGRLSALCGCVVAATGSSCGITYLMGGDFAAVSFAVKNMVANITGMICDGAKPSCSLKLTAGATTAALSALMAMEGHYVTANEGIIDDDVDQCIRNMTLIGREGMTQTDALILQIMTGKKH